ncbi:MAG: heme ABC transporter ATP-binding protein, partial [Anaerolineae bacterium]
LSPAEDQAGVQLLMGEPVVALGVRGVEFSYGHGDVLQGIGVEIRAGERVALIGPNGSGKTTLLRLLSGFLRPDRGEVRLEGRLLSQYSRREVARRLAVVPQTLEVPFAFTVEELVLMGRTPYMSPWGGPGPRDVVVVREALERMGVSPLEDRPYPELSGGERQRVVLALALAQEPQILLLDEPTAHLDINHQVEVLDLVRALNRESGLTVAAAMHDLNLAALYFGRLLLLDGGRIVADGPPQKVLEARRIARAFGARVRIQDHPVRAVPQVILLPQEALPQDGSEAVS